MDGQTDRPTPESRRRREGAQPNDRDGQQNTVMQTDDEEEAVGVWAQGILCGSKEAERGWIRGVRMGKDMNIKSFKTAHKKPGMKKFSHCVPKTFDFCSFTLGP